MSAEKNAFELGWRAAAAWADRDDLLSDIGSPAYLADMQAALSARCTRRDAMTTKDGGPAFPRPGANLRVAGGREMYDEGDAGMTLRDYFAAKAMQGFINNPRRFSATADDSTLCAEAYSYADAMLAAREQTP